MIEGQLLRPMLTVTVLADVPITGENIDARKLDGAMAVFELHQFEQSHHGGELDGNRDAVNLAVVDLENFNLALPEESDCLLPMDDTQGFVRGVEQERHFHSTTSFPTEAPSVRGPGVGLGTVLYFYAISFLRNQALGHVATTVHAPRRTTVQMDQAARYV